MCRGTYLSVTRSERSSRAEARVVDLEPGEERVESERLTEASAREAVTKCPRTSLALASVSLAVSARASRQGLPSSTTPRRRGGPWATVALPLDPPGSHLHSNKKGEAQEDLALFRSRRG